MVSGHSHRAAALVCLLALAGMASSRTAGAAGPQSAATQPPEPGAGPSEQQQQLAQYTVLQQTSPSNSTSFPASADTFLRALQTLHAAGSLFQGSTYNAASLRGAQWWSIQPADVPQMRSQAALLANGLKLSAGSFGGMFAELMAQASVLSCHHWAHGKQCRGSTDDSVA